MQPVRGWTGERHTAHLAELKKKQKNVLSTMQVLFKQGINLIEKA